jgi:hypothetical protein
VPEEGGVVNRRARRHAAAEARRARGRTGYVHRLVAASDAISAMGPGVVHVICHHDPGCAIYTGRSCNCVPQISAHPDGGSTVIEIDEDGRARKREAS